MKRDKVAQIVRLSQGQTIYIVKGYRFWLHKDGVTCHFTLNMSYITNQKFDLNHVLFGGIVGMGATSSGETEGNRREQYKLTKQRCKA